MRILFKIIVVVSAILLEVAVLEIGSEFIFGLRHGMIVDSPYRREERLAALTDSLQHPSPETKARFQEELRLMHKHEDWKAYLGVGLFFAINAVWIFYYFRGVRSSTAPKPPVAVS
jgi:hypothetical protein